MPASRRGFLTGLLGGATGALVRPELALAAPEPVEPEPLLRTTVDGEAVAAPVGPDTTALDWLRARGKLSPKPGCGHGACGACAIRVDDRVVASCLLPALHLEGRAVRSAPPDALHPVQRAFAAHDALQCGYCTPGFLQESIALHDRWRASMDRPPTRAEVDDALAGHLCRCGAYASIHAAVIAACAGEFDGPEETLARPDAAEKVRGAARYTVDEGQGALVGRILRSTIAAGSVTLDLAPARAVPGVKAVIRVVADAGLVRYAGQELAAVAADSAEAAEAGLRAIAVTWRPTRPVIGIDASRAPDAPLVYAERKPEAPNANEGPLLGAKWDGNQRGPTSANMLAKPHAAREAVARARAGEGVLVEGVFDTQAQVHTPLEPRAVVADWRPERLIVHASTQAVRALALDLAERYDLREDQIEVHAAHVGGAFGSKAGLGPEVLIAVNLSREAGAPVRYVASRAEELTVGGSRPPERIHLAAAFDADGQLAGLVGDTTTDSGVAVGSTIGLLMRFHYAGGERDLSDLDAVTNAAPAKPFRAPGGPPAFFALESLVDDYAAKVGRDPLAVRRVFDQNPVRARLYDRLEQAPIWRDRPRAETGRYRRGVGMAASSWLYFASPNTQVRLDAGRDGITVSCAVQDMGNGARSVLHAAVAEVFELPPDRLHVRVGDSRDLPGPMSAGSRTTASVWPAARKAALNLMEDLTDAAHDLGWTDAVAERGGLRRGDRLVPWADVLAATPPVTVTARRPRDPGGYFLPFSIAELKIGKGLNAAVGVAELEVDTRLGKIKPLRSWIGVGAGRLIQPRVARSQVEGATVQGWSYALYEERRLCPRTGRNLTHDLEEYRIMGIGDAPEIEVVFDTEPFPGTDGPIGLAEVATCPHAAAIGNAVFAATGWRPRALPLTPERVLAGLGGRA